MYGGPKAFYLILACLDHSERRKSTHVLKLTSEPHGARLNDVVEAFVEHFHLHYLHQTFLALGSGCLNLEVSGNVEQYSVLT